MFSPIRTFILHKYFIHIIPHLIMRLAKLFVTLTNLSYSIPKPHLYIPPLKGVVSQIKDSVCSQFKAG